MGKIIKIPLNDYIKILTIIFLSRTLSKGEFLTTERRLGGLILYFEIRIVKRYMNHNLRGNFVINTKYII